MLKYGHIIKYNGHTYDFSEANNVKHDNNRPISSSESTPPSPWKQFIKSVYTRQAEFSLA